MPGGVCAVLDYEVDVMAEYVADMAMRLVMPQQTVTVAFRKFVSGVLTSTRLPSTTILLGMNYLAKRVNHLKSATSFKPTEGQVWRMLTVALLMGSKFLDDNTFQNRSWAEVSGIRVKDLNEMEYEWLRDCQWCLYVNLDKSDDYNAWISSWKEWQSGKKREQLAHRQRSERLTPIVTSMRQPHHPLSYEGWIPEEIAEAEAMNMARKQSYRPREGSWHGQYPNVWQPAAPLTPPDSGYGTPEYLNSAASLNAQYNEYFESAVASSYNRYPLSANYNGNRASGHFQQPYYGHYGASSTWDKSAGDCSCTMCMANIHRTPHYFHQQHPSYGQTVMG